MGAIATGGVRVMNPDVTGLQIPEATIATVVAREQKELERRERLYRGDRAPLRFENRIVVFVDDGLATGSTMRAAAMAARNQRPQRVVVAVPVAAPETCAAFRTEVDEVVCASTPQPFRAVGLWYDDFKQVSDDEVHALLEASWESETTRTA